MANAPALAKLGIAGDGPPAAVRRAFTRSVWLAVGALVVIGGVVFYLRRGSPLAVQVVTAASSGAGGGGGGTGMVANGYVVARTKAAVSAKIPGRLASLDVSEGSRVSQGEVIARLDNADYVAAEAQAEAQVASARATLIELATDRDQQQREFARVRTIHTQNPNLVSQQEVEAAESRAEQSAARATAQEARVTAADAGVRFAHANLEKDRKSV